MGFCSELKRALKSDDTEKYLELQRKSGKFKKISENKRTIEINKRGSLVEKLILKAGVEAP